MKKILMIGTGGTIASEMTEAGLAPGMEGADFLRYVPAVEKLCQVDPLQVCNIDSTDMTPDRWLDIARAVEAGYDHYDGFVLCHGTDTLAYTAAALSYLIQGSPKPIVLTGSQKPIHMDITDSKTNLWDSFAVACDGRLPGVTVVFGGRILLGTRARKTYSKSYGAFSSINHPILGVVREGKVTLTSAPRPRPGPPSTTLWTRRSPWSSWCRGSPRTSWPLPWRPATGWWWRASAPAGSPPVRRGAFTP